MFIYCAILLLLFHLLLVINILPEPLHLHTYDLSHWRVQPPPHRTVCLL